jgi:hypothetical protein
MHSIADSGGLDRSSDAFDQRGLRPGATSQDGSGLAPGHFVPWALCNPEEGREGRVGVILNGCAHVVCDVPAIDVDRSGVLSYFDI